MLKNKSLINGFELTTPNKEQILKKLQRTTNQERVVRRNPLSSKLSLFEQLSVAKELVERRLGKYGTNTVLIQTEEELAKYIESSINNGVIAIDTETNNSLDPITCKIMGACLYTPNNKQAYVPIHHSNIATDEKLPNQLTEDILRKYFDKIKQTNTKIIMHNAKFDIQVIDFTCYNGNINSLTCYWDTMLAAKILDENEKSNLKMLYSKYIDNSVGEYDIETFFKGIPYTYVHPSIFALYAATDAYMTYKLYEWQREEFDRIGDPNLFSIFMDTEMGVLPCVVDMEMTGLGIDLTYAKNLSISYNKALKEAKEEVFDALLEYQPLIEEYRLLHQKRGKLDSPIKISSPIQLAILLYDILKLPPSDSENPRSTDEEALEGLNHPLVKPLLKYKYYTKLVSTYIDKLPQTLNPKTHKIHANFNQIGREERTVVTGRFSSSEPNLQNIPSHDKKIRPMFMADDGCVIVGGDFSQQEPRLLAHCSQDRELIGAYAKGRDLYASAAAKTFNKDYWECMENFEDGTPNPAGKVLRGNMKQIILGIIYGRGARSIAEKTGQTLEEAQNTIETFYGAYPIVKKWMDGTVKSCKEIGFVSTIRGRRRRLPNIQLEPYTIIDKGQKNILENNVLFEEIKVRKTNNTLVDKYKEELEQAKYRKQKEEIIKKAYSDNIIIEDNSKKISGATRQSVNAVIQGSAADLSKMAMIAIYKNKELRDLGFRMMYVIHDEIAGQCPRENAERVATILKETMIGSAKEICSVPMKVDTYTISHWYFDDLSNTIKERYDNLINRNEKKGIAPIGEEEAFKIIDKENPEIDLDILRDMCNGTIDLTSSKFARKLYMG